jgi:hypothetical protein
MTLESSVNNLTTDERGEYARMRGSSKDAGLRFSERSLKPRYEGTTMAKPPAAVFGFAHRNRR